MNSSVAPLMPRTRNSLMIRLPAAKTDVMCRTSNTMTVAAVAIGAQIDLRIGSLHSNGLREAVSLSSRTRGCPARAALGYGWQRSHHRVVVRAHAPAAP